MSSGEWVSFANYISTKFSKCSFAHLHLKLAISVHACSCMRYEVSSSLFAASSSWPSDLMWTRPGEQIDETIVKIGWFDGRLKTVLFYYQKITILINKLSVKSCRSCPIRSIPASRFVPEEVTLWFYVASPTMLLQSRMRFYFRDLLVGNLLLQALNRSAWPVCNFIRSAYVFTCIKFFVGISKHTIYRSLYVQVLPMFHSPRWAQQRRTHIHLKDLYILVIIFFGKVLISKRVDLIGWIPTGIAAKRVTWTLSWLVLFFSNMLYDLVTTYLLRHAISCVLFPSHLGLWNLLHNGIGLHRQFLLRVVFRLKSIFISVFSQKTADKLLRYSFSILQFIVTLNQVIFLSSNPLLLLPRTLPLAPTQLTVV